MDRNDFYFVEPEMTYNVGDFDYYAYKEAEDELRMIFPEVGNHRVNFLTFGCSNVLLIDSDRTGQLGFDETYIIMPETSTTFRSIRMRILRRLTIGEYRMACLSAEKISGSQGVNDLFNKIYEVMRGE